MFNKEGIPFFVIVIPFLSIILVSFLSISYYLKLSNNNLDLNIKEYKELYSKTNRNSDNLEELIQNKTQEYKNTQKNFNDFILVATLVVIIFMAFFSFIMILLVRDIIKKYKDEVKDTEDDCVPRKLGTSSNGGELVSYAA